MSETRPAAPGAVPARLAARGLFLWSLARGFPSALLLVPAAFLAAGAIWTCGAVPGRRA